MAGGRPGQCAAGTHRGIVHATARPGRASGSACMFDMDETALPIVCGHNEKPDEEDDEEEEEEHEDDDEAVRLR